MQRQSVKSSSLESLGYDPASSTLEVEFRNHRIYRYVGVPQQVFAELQSADSIGSYFSSHIRNEYECWRLVTRPQHNEPGSESREPGIS